MTDEQTEREFRETADTFIKLANEHIESQSKENVGMALLYAASRFNAFVVAAHNDNLKDFEGDHDRAIGFFMVEYLRMLQENLDDYKRAYKDQQEAADPESGA